MRHAGAREPRRALPRRHAPRAEASAGKASATGGATEEMLSFVAKTVEALQAEVAGAGAPFQSSTEGHKGRRAEGQKGRRGRRAERRTVRQPRMHRQKGGEADRRTSPQGAGAAASAAVFSQPIAEPLKKLERAPWPLTSLVDAKELDNILGCDTLSDRPLRENTPLRRSQTWLTRNLYQEGRWPGTEAAESRPGRRSTFARASQIPFRPRTGPRTAASLPPVRPSSSTSRLCASRVSCAER